MTEQLLFRCLPQHATERGDADATRPEKRLAGRRSVAGLKNQAVFHILCWLRPLVLRAAPTGSEKVFISWQHQM
jgi:hypothetical protein